MANPALLIENPGGERKGEYASSKVAYNTVKSYSKYHPMNPKENQLIQGLRSARKVGIIGKIINEAARSNSPEVHQQLITMMKDQVKVARYETMLLIGRKNMDLLNQL